MKVEILDTPILNAGLKSVPPPGKFHISSICSSKIYLSNSTAYVLKKMTISYILWGYY
jgi:hypothetical protein